MSRLCQIRTCTHYLLVVIALSVVPLAWTSRPLEAQDAVNPESYLRLHYEKREVLIPMRDGTRLFTAIYTPRDTTKKYPILIKRTPYSCSPYGEDNYPALVGPSDHFVKAGYIFVNQDVRGRFMSEGKFQQVTPHIVNKQSPQDVDESSDAYDTIDWLIKNVEHHNGAVGMFGISYPGFYSSAGMIDAHPNLKAVSPQAPVGDWYFDDFLHHGAFFLAHAFRWLNNNAQDRGLPTSDRSAPNPIPTIDGYKLFLEAGTIEEINRRFLKDSIPFWKEMMEHPNRDEFWKRRDILPHLRHVAPAVMTVTGWYDAEDLYGSFKTYRSTEKLNPGVKNILVVGPWVHGGWASTDGDRLGKVTFGSKTAAFYRAEIELPFFEKYLKGKELAEPAEATVFETGSNTWRVFDHWPPARAVKKSLYLHAGGKLSFDPPSESPTPAFDEYISDPAKPVPYSEEVTPRMTNEYMTDDQRFASRRPDVLTYQTEILNDDLVLAGAMPIDLWVSTSAGDADFVVKLIDVFPDGNDPATLPGYQMMVRSEVIRGRYRNSYEHPEPFTANQPAKIRLELLDVLHRFKKGHRVMIQIQSTWFPLVDRNPQKYVDNIYFAKPGDFEKATHRVYRSGEHTSVLEVQVLP